MKLLETMRQAGTIGAPLEAAVRSGQIAARALARDRPAEHLASGA